MRNAQPPQPPINAADELKKQPVLVTWQQRDEAKIYSWRALIRRKRKETGRHDDHRKAACSDLDNYQDLERPPQQQIGSRARLPRGVRGGGLPTPSTQSSFLSLFPSAPHPDST